MKSAQHVMPHFQMGASLFGNSAHNLESRHMCEPTKVLLSHYVLRASCLMRLHVLSKHDFLKLFADNITASYNVLRNFDRDS